MLWGLRAVRLGAICSKIIIYFWERVLIGEFLIKMR
jgi:hypothetical protein